MFKGTCVKCTINRGFSEVIKNHSWNAGELHEVLWFSKQLSRTVRFIP